MKKQIWMALALLFSVSVADVAAQSFLKKIGKAVEKEVKNRVEKEIDKKVNGQKSASKKKGASASASADSPRNYHVTVDVATAPPIVEYGPLAGKKNGHEWVDMGLPSGTRWATCNVDASAPEQPGKLYAWGEVTTKSAYTQASSKYHGKELADFSGNKTYDVATLKWGEGWRMPRKEDYDELQQYCRWRWVQRGDVWGTEFTSIVTGNVVFLPCTGFMDGTKHLNKRNGLYWTSTPKINKEWKTAAHIYQFGSALGEVTDGGREYGFGVRAVTDYDTDTTPPSTGEINGHKYVDLGLPSGVKWATCNLGTDVPDQDGYAFTWGSATRTEDPLYAKSDLSGKEMGDLGGNPAYDAARAMWGGTWRVPTVQELKELAEHCTWEWTSMGRRSGMKVISKTNGNYIFLPAEGLNLTICQKLKDKQYRSANYWSSTPQVTEYNVDAYSLSVSDRGINIFNISRNKAIRIRPVSK